MVLAEAMIEFRALLAQTKRNRALASHGGQRKYSMAGGQPTGIVLLAYSRPPNALTLSCKSRPPCRPQKSGAAADATNNAVAGANCSRRDAGVQFGAAQGGSAAEPGLGGFCQLVRVVSRFWRFVRFKRLRKVSYVDESRPRAENGRPQS